MALDQQLISWHSYWVLGDVVLGAVLPICASESKKVVELALDPGGTSTGREVAL